MAKKMGGAAFMAKKKGAMAAGKPVMAGTLKGGTGTAASMGGKMPDRMGGMQKGKMTKGKAGFPPRMK